MKDVEKMALICRLIICRGVFGVTEVVHLSERRALRPHQREFEGNLWFDFGLAPEREA